MLYYNSVYRGMAAPIKPEQRGYDFGPNSPEIGKAFNYGLGLGDQILNQDPEINQIMARYEDRSKGYNSQELGALKEAARSDLAGSRSNYLTALQGNLGRAGVGGARAAAAKAAADNKFLATQADQDRKIALDSAQMQRQGLNDYADLAFKRKFGVLGTGLGVASLDSSARAAAAASAAANRPKEQTGIDKIVDAMTLGYGRNWSI